jgi:hypothetical protein
VILVLDSLYHLSLLCNLCVQVGVFLTRSNKAFESLRMKIPTDSDTVLSPEKVAEKIASITGISGGYCSTASCVSQRIGDEEDDDNDEEDENDEVEEDEEEEVPLN